MSLGSDTAEVARQAPRSEDAHACSIGELALFESVGSSVGSSVGLGFGLAALGFGLAVLGFGLTALGFGLTALGQLGFGLTALGHLGFDLNARGFEYHGPAARGIDAVAVFGIRLALEVVLHELEQNGGTDAEHHEFGAGSDMVAEDAVDAEHHQNSLDHDDHNDGMHRVRVYGESRTCGCRLCVYYSFEKKKYRFNFFRILKNHISLNSAYVVFELATKGATLCEWYDQVVIPRALRAFSPRCKSIVSCSWRWASASCSWRWASASAIRRERSWDNRNTRSACSASSAFSSFGRMSIIVSAANPPSIMSPYFSMSIDPIVRRVDRKE